MLYRLMHRHTRSNPPYQPAFPLGSYNKVMLQKCKSSHTQKCPGWPAVKTFVCRRFLLTSRLRFGLMQHLTHKHPHFPSVFMLKMSKSHALTFWRFPRVVSHRGGGSLAPENTLLAMQTGVKYGIPAVEFDVMLSRDKVPMVIHDEELRRTVRNSAHIGKMFNELDAQELLTLDAGSYFDPSLSQVRIPLFEDVLKFCLENHVFMNIEIKPATGHEIRTGVVVAEMTARYYDRLANAGVAPVFSSFCFDSLKAAKEVAPHIPRGLLLHQSLDDVPDWKEQVTQLDAVSLNVNKDYLTEEHVNEIKGFGRGVFVYTVNDLDEAEKLLSWGVDCLCTDKIDTFSPLAAKLRS